MARIRRSLLAGAGGYLPGHLVTNDDLAATLDTSDAWIRERTGICQRYRVGPEDNTTSMAAAAARRALAMAGATAADVDLIIVGTSTPDQAFPSVAVRVQALLGVEGGFGFDVSAACAGFVYALSLADDLIRAGRARGALVIGSESFSRILDYTDRGTCCSATGRARSSSGPPRAHPKAHLKVGARTVSCRRICMRRAVWATSCSWMARSACATAPASPCRASCG
jgi:3-oxoacyl-(acyl-carrier-protein) synthase III